jgi:hypothetical protein
MECEKEFGFFKRKHHCRACGSVVCSACSPYQANIPTIEEVGGSRVCVNCFGLKVTVNGLKQDTSSLDDESFENISSSDGHGSSTYSGCCFLA